jgi:CRISPR-associated protein (TIGR02710 family)
LDELCAPSPRDPYLQVEDLLFNAERRAGQQRYDDAVARVYRALELVAQIRLKTKYGIDTANVELGKIPQPLLAELECARSAEGRVELGLLKAWILLETMPDPVLGPWFTQRKGQVKDFLSVRNSSILAHGVRPVDEAVYREKGQRGISLCREALEKIPLAERGNRRCRQLPPRF